MPPLSSIRRPTSARIASVLALGEGSSTPMSSMESRCWYFSWSKLYGVENDYFLPINLQVDSFYLRRSLPVNKWCISLLPLLIASSWFEAIGPKKGWAPLMLRSLTSPATSCDQLWPMWPPKNSIVWYCYDHGGDRLVLVWHSVMIFLSYDHMWPYYAEGL